MACNAGGDAVCRWGVVEVELRASNCEDKAANENLKRHKILSTVGLSLLLILVSLTHDKSIACFKFGWFGG